MSKYRICENQKGQFKIQCKELGLIWWDYKEAWQGNVKLFANYETAEKYIRTLIMWKEARRINKIKKNSWSCKGEYYCNE